MRRYPDARSQLPVRELYIRHSKTLIGVGASGGDEKKLGYAYEWVALTNPYTLSKNQKVQLQLWKGDRPVAHQSVSVFTRGNGDNGQRVLPVRHRTDSKGTLSLQVSPGDSVLVNTVCFTPTPERDTVQALAWQSDWVSMSFSVPS
ncbi:MAG: DUF4198 domain-containing protein [Pseudomonadota bacterium]